MKRYKLICQIKTNKINGETVMIYQTTHIKRNEGLILIEAEVLFRKSKPAIQNIIKSKEHMKIIEDKSINIPELTTVEEKIFLIETYILDNARYKNNQIEWMV